jgi:hypothetical protein
MSDINYDEFHFLMAVIFLLIAFFFVAIKDKTWIAMMLLAIYFLGYNLWSSSRRGG